MYIFGIVLLGIVVFIHELGHFIFAKLFKVKVTAFSIGFGKPLIKWKKGDTEYRISIVPLGGYVKMTGENPDEEKSLTKKEINVSFSGKKWWQKVLIAMAGPVFNIFLAVLVFLIVSFYEYTAPAPIVEYLNPNGPAAEAGIEEGDRIMGINGNKVHVWDDISTNLHSLKNCGKISVTVKSYKSGTLKNLTVNSATGTYKDAFNDTLTRCEIGIARIPRDTVIALKSKVKGLRNGDKILSVNGRKVDRFYQVQHLAYGQVHKITLLREGKKELVFFNNSRNLSEHIIYGGMMLSKIEKNSFARVAGFKKGDVIVSLNRQKTTMPYQFYATLSKLEESDSALVSIIRDSHEKEISFKIAVEEKDNTFTGMKDKKIKWGAKFLVNYNIPEVKASRTNPVFFSLNYSLKQTWNTIKMTLKGFWYLVSGKMSAKSLGGPIMIFDISKRAAEAGMRYFLFILAVVSINLGVVNLLPVPILDGGHIVMYTVEGFMGKKIPISIKEKILTVGFVLLMLLMTFAIFNDFSRYISVFTGV